MRTYDAIRKSERLKEKTGYALSPAQLVVHCGCRQAQGRDQLHSEGAIGVPRQLRDPFNRMQGPGSRQTSRRCPRQGCATRLLVSPHRSLGLKTPPLRCASRRGERGYFLENQEMF